ncbi:MAG TPA: hypothetical protein VIC27_06630 [Ktedonobacterales bacterium]
MSERPDDATARQQRLAALRKLAGEQPQSVSAEPQPTTAPHPAQPGPAVGQRIGAEAEQPASGARRWRTVALASVAALVIVGVVGAALWQRGALFGQPGARSAAALSAKVFTVSGAAGVYCSSTPAWSPDSKSIAVFGQTNPPTDTCVPYDPQLALIATGVSSTQSVNHADGYALVTLDSATGHIRQRITLPTPDQSALCGGASPCAIENPNVQSLAWSPDGHSVAIFFTYERMTGAVNVNAAQGIQECGGLLIVPVGAAASATPRLLLAAAAPAVAGATSLDGLPLFTWNLTSGAATTSAIPGALTGATPPIIPSYQWTPNGQFIQTSGDTIPFASAYQWTPDGQLAASSSQTRGAIAPWRSGVIGLRHSANDPVLFRTSQWIWSPDGQFVTPDLQTSAYISIPGATQPASSGAYTPPLVSAPNGAMRAIPAYAIYSQVGVELAQSPDGALLATYTCAPDDTGRLTLLPTKSGDALTQADYTYSTNDLSLACFGGISQPVWSPNGSHIAIDDTQNAQIIFWQVNVRS